MGNSPRWTDHLPRRAELTEEEFRFLLAGQAGDFLLLSNGLLEAAPEQWSQRQIYHLYRAATDLETFLDDFGARENRAFFPIREVTALVRWLALAMTSLVHLDSRVQSYQLADPAWASEVLAVRVRRGALELGELVLRALQHMREAWLSNGMTWPGHVLRVDSLMPSGLRPRLPRNVLEDRERLDGDLVGTHPAARLAASYLLLLETLDRLGTKPVVGLASLRQFVAARYTEELARSYEARVHNLQSSYDSFVAGRQEEAEHPELRVVRGSVSQALHLFEAGTCLAHLYERHDVYGRHAARVFFAHLIPEEKLLDILVNTCTITAYDGLLRCRAVAEGILRKLTRQVAVDLDLPPGASLHARPISLIVSVVNHHGTPVEMEIAGKKASAASIMQLLMLAGANPDARRVRFTGDEEALRDLRDLFAIGLGEGGLDALPPRLEYLKPS